MPIDVGSLRAITFVVFDKSDVDLGKQVRLQVARYAQVSGDIKTLVNEVPRVTVNIKKYRGSGAVTIYRTSSISVDRSLSGGVPEIAESVLFELCNWNQGDFSTREHERVKNGEITPEQAGKNIAKCESKTVHQHGQFLQALKSKGVPLSNYGERNRAATHGKTLAEVEQQTMISKHDNDAKATDPTSLVTPQMYWYQMIEGRYHPDDFHIPVMKRGINEAIPEWLADCIEKTWASLYDSDKSLFYIKLFALAKEYGFTIKGGYEYTQAMKTVAGEPTDVAQIDKNMLQSNVIGKVKDEPGDLAAKMGEVGLQ